nr:immunoglobulin heavy chain junction region [Macaca mulatta]MOX39180.1 immunoglobulin heavy chain junction region [Macaca mulatta]MOX39674.1 immunoglobulin heavy chain junction region [Macaca mulatta]
CARVRTYTWNPMIYYFDYW